MKEIKCTIIQDVLPLYIDEVVSPDTKEMVEDHLEDCEKCQQEYEGMKQELFIPQENKVSIFNKINKQWLEKKVKISTVSVLATVIILFGAFFYIVYYDRVIPYSKNLIKIESQDDNTLVSHYDGEGYESVNTTHPIQLEINGEKKNISFLFYTKTIAKSPSRNLFNNKKSGNEQNYTFQLAESEKIDAVYYGEFDIMKIAEKKDSWHSVIDRSVLIWEK